MATLKHQESITQYCIKTLLNCIGKFSYNNEREALLLSKPFQKSKAKYNSEDEESEEVDDTDTVLKFEADEVAIFKRYKAFLAHGS